MVTRFFTKDTTLGELEQAIQEDHRLHLLQSNGRWHALYGGLARTGITLPEVLNLVITQPNPFKEEK